MKKLMVHEIFLSVSGECGIIRQGEWCYFIRLAGCNLRCSWCDTERAQESHGREMTVREIVKAVTGLADRGVYKVVVTGGEPLLQSPVTLDLLNALLNADMLVQVETNGSFLPPVVAGVIWIVDYKLPSSGMESRMISMDDFHNIPVGSWVKFVIASEADYLKAVSVCQQLEGHLFHFAFSACPPGMSHAELYNRMKADLLVNIVLSVQIHKLAQLNEGV